MDDMFLQLAVMFLALVAASGGSVPLINWLKGLLDVKDQGAVVLSWCVALLVALATAVVSGEVSPDLLDSPEAVAAVIATVVGMTQKIYRSGWVPD